MINQARNFPRYLRFLAKYSDKQSARGLLYALSLTVIGASITALSPVFLRYATDAEIGVYPEIYFWIGLYVLSIVAGRFMAIGGTFYNTSAIEQLNTHLGRSIITNSVLLQHKGSSMNSAEWIQRLQSAKNNNSSIITSMVTIIIPLSGRVVLSIFALCFFRDFFTCVVLAVYIIGAIALNYRRTISISNKYAKFIESNIFLSKIFGDTFNNLETITLFNGTTAALSRFDRAVEVQKSRNEDVITSNQYIEMTNSILFASVLLITLCHAGYLVSSNSATIGYFIMVNAFVYQVCQPLEGLLRVLASVADSAASLKQQTKSLNLAILFNPPSHDKAHGDFLSSHTDVSFENVSFNHPGTVHHQIDLLNMSVRGPGIIAIVGPSGSGKTTLMRLLSGGAKPTAGKIFINGTDINAIDRYSLHEKLCLVEQRSQIFNDTLRFNLQIASFNVDDDHLINAIYECQLGDWFETLPNGLDTRLGENGATMSGGQVQRIGFARAIIRDTDIILVDEGTSALDLVTETSILHLIKKLAERKTLFLVTHKKSSMALAKYVVVLEPGKRSEFGPLVHLNNSNSYLKSLEAYY